MLLEQCLDLVLELHGKGIARLFETQRHGNASLPGRDAVDETSVDDVLAALGVYHTSEQPFDHIFCLFHNSYSNLMSYGQ